VYDSAFEKCDSSSGDIDRSSEDSSRCPTYSGEFDVADEQPNNQLSNTVSINTAMMSTAMSTQMSTEVSDKIELVVCDRFCTKLQIEPLSAL